MKRLNRILTHEVMMAVGIILVMVGVMIVMVLVVAQLTA